MTISPGVSPRKTLVKICGVTTPEQALALHQLLPNSVLNWVEQGGHSSMDPAVAEALVKAVIRLEGRDRR